MTDEALCTWLESTGFPQASDAASRIRNKNIELEKALKTVSVVTPPTRWPELGNIAEPPVEVVHTPKGRKKV